MITVEIYRIEKEEKSFIEEIYTRAFEDLCHFFPYKMGYMLLRAGGFVIFANRTSNV